ncbi:MAG TPA: serine hydrolase [Mycobacteriales bacterium]|nr:serine hydrolase [Mycobacteriales bacterium]
MADLAAQIRHLVEQERARFDVPGCAVLVVKDGEVVLAEGFGRRDRDRDLPVTAQTLFPIGSSTKTFTAAVCASLVDEGHLEWDRPLREYLPGFRMHDPVATELLSVRDCLSHRSGLPRHDVLWYAAAEGSLDRDDLIAALSDLPPTKPFRQVWQYNNLLYVTAGHLAGKLSGGSFEDAVRRRLLEPLGMRRTNFSVVETQADADHSQPYVRAIGETETKEVPYAPLDLAGPAGSINSSLEDMTPWLLTLLGHGVDGKPQLLSDAVLADLRKPTMPLPEGTPFDVGTPVGYGLALFIEDYRGHRLTHHGGNIDGFSSQVATIADSGVGVVVLTNLGGTSLRDALPYLIFDVLLGLDPKPHGERLFERYQALLTGAAQAKERHETISRSADLPPVRSLADYAGRYVHPAYGALTVRHDDGVLLGRYQGLAEGRLEHRHLEVFDLVTYVGGEDYRLPVQFTHDLEGEVDALAAKIEPMLDALRFPRQPDTAHLTDELLDRLAGTYRLGPVQAVVARRGDVELVASIAGSEPKQLKPVRGTTFSLDGATVEFLDDGRLITPSGDFVRST